MEKLNLPSKVSSKKSPVNLALLGSNGKRKVALKKKPVTKRPRRKRLMDPIDDSIDPPPKDPFEESSEDELEAACPPDSKYLPTIIKPTPSPVGYFVPTPCRFRKRLRRYKKVDKSLPKILQCRQRKDGTWVFHKKLMQQIMKPDSPDYRDLKAKRFNTSFLKTTPRPQTIEIFAPDEEAGVPMPFIPNLPNITDGEPGAKYADVFRFLPRDDSDDDENEKKKEVKKRGRRKSLKWKGGPLADKNLLFNYDWLLDASSSSEVDDVSAPSTSKSKSEATSKNTKKTATVSKKMTTSENEKTVSEKKKGCTKKSEMKSDNVEFCKGKITNKKLLPVKKFSSSENDVASPYSSSNEDDVTVPSTPKSKNGATSKKKKMAASENKKAATLENKKTASERKKRYTKKNEVKSNKAEFCEDIVTNKKVLPVIFSSSENDDLVIQSSSLNEDDDVAVPFGSKSEETSKTKKTVRTINKKMATSENKKIISEKKKGCTKKNEVKSNSADCCKDVTNKKLLPVIFSSSENDDLVSSSASESKKTTTSKNTKNSVKSESKKNGSQNKKTAVSENKKMVKSRNKKATRSENEIMGPNKFTLLPGEQAVNNCILRVHLHKLPV